MSMVKWNIGFMIGIHAMDENHRLLVQLLNEAYDEFVMGINIEEEFIEGLVKCIARGFDYEENFMLTSSYPKFAEHKAEHDIFTTRLLDIRKNYRQDATTSIQILMFLNNWIIHHIRQSDAQLGNFVEVQNLTKRIATECQNRKNC